METRHPKLLYTAGRVCERRAILDGLNQRGRGETGPKVGSPLHWRPVTPTDRRPAIPTAGGAATLRRFTLAPLVRAPVEAFDFHLQSLAEARQKGPRSRGFPPPLLVPLEIAHVVGICSSIYQCCILFWTGATGFRPERLMNLTGGPLKLPVWDPKRGGSKPPLPNVAIGCRQLHRRGFRVTLSDT